MLLSVKNLRTYFKTQLGPARAVDDVSFDIEEGETYSLVGESGCGKSVTALSIMQLIAKPAGYIAGGEILYRGQDIVKLAPNAQCELRGNEIGMIFQEPMTALNPVLSIGYQMAEPLLLHKGLSKLDARNLSIEWLERVGIPEAEKRMDEYPHQLSGGMRQRVMIAMAMSCEPGLLIADEPTTALDVTVQAQILDLMKELQEKNNTAILLITHDLGVVAQTADRVGVMYAGRIAEEAAVDSVLLSPHHPYTGRLLQSIPTRSSRENELVTIPGRVLPANKFPEGCRFAPRCHRRQEICRSGEIPTVAINDAHSVNCVLYDKNLQNEIINPASVHTSTAKPRDSHDKNSTDVILSAKGVKIHFPIKKGIFRKTVGHVKAVDGIDFEIRAGETVALVGESGCGKTTFGKGLLQLVRPTAGEVLVGTQNLVELSRYELKPYRSKFQIMFQDPFSSLDPRMMIGETITEGLVAHGAKKSRSELSEVAAELMRKVGLDPDMLYRYPHEFSGGQRQRIGIARALAVNPSVIICDEPTSALDVSVQAQIVNLLLDLQAELGLSYVFISHDLSLVTHLSHRIAVMYLGEIVELATATEFASSAAHPYSQALLSAAPEVDIENRKLRIRLKGEPPSPINPPKGCRFHPRCPHAFERCRGEHPPLYKTKNGREVRCFLSEQEATDEGSQ